MNTKPSIIVLQACVPDYRIAFFDALAQHVPNLNVYSGECYYVESIRTAAIGERWYRSIRNFYLLGRRALWQQFPLSLVFTDDVLVMELNPRTLNAWILCIIRKLLCKPLVFWGHAWARSGFTSHTTFVRLLMWHLCDVKLVYTRRQARELSGSLRGVIIPARNALYSAQSTRARIIRERKRFIYVGRMVPDKKPELAIRAFATFAAKNVEAHLDMVGEGPESRRLQEICINLNIETRVTFHGHVSEFERLEVLYDDAIAALSPGYVGLSATQAFFFGVPMLVASNEPHSPEIEACRTNFNTLFFPSDDVRQFADLLEVIWNHRILWDQASKKIQDDVCARYSVEKMVDAFLLAAAVSGKFEYKCI